MLPRSRETSALAIALIVIGAILLFFGITMIEMLAAGRRGGGPRLNELMIYAGVGLMVIGAALFVIEIIR